MEARAGARSLAVVAAGLVAASALGAGALVVAPPEGTPRAAAAPALRTFGSCAEVDAWLAEQRRTAPTTWPNGWLEDQAVPASGTTASAQAAAAGAATGQAVGASGTGTNTQEASVDEADTAKVRDGLLYAVDRFGLRVVDVGGPAPTEIGRLALPRGPGPDDAELVLAGDTAVILSRTPAPPTGPAGPTGPDAWGEPGVRGPAPVEGTTTATLVDLADPRHPTKLTSIDMPGRTIAAREHDGIVRWVTTSMARPVGLDCTRIAHPVDPSGPGVLTVQALDPRAARAAAGAGTKGDAAAVRRDATAVTASGAAVYASPDRLYVATTMGGRWGDIVPAVAGAPASAGDVGRAATPLPPTLPATPSTWVHAFDTAGTQLRYVDSGQVEGRLLNRWSMSERGGALRVATTRTLPAPPNTDAAVTVLTERDGRLAPVGQVTGLGKGEQIKAVRWFDDVGVVVTFRQTDPLYVLDLADPAHPRLRGELKVPGFSTYLHPLGDHRLLGVGTAATTQGTPTGAQLATFDVADPARPTRLDVAETPGASVEVGSDPRSFAYLPAVRTALVPGYGLAGGATGGGAYAIRGYAVAADGRLSTVGTVPLAGLVQAHQVTLGPHRVAVVGLTWRDAAMGTRVALLDAGEGRLTQTGAVTLSVAG